MKIGVVSDTHGSTNALRQAISAVGTVDAWFHLGDGADDITRMRDELGVPVYAVAGNCDTFSSEPKVRQVELGGKRFFLTHGDMYSVKYSTQMLSLVAEEAHCDVALYGHTHLPDVEYGRVYILNPGSAARPFNGIASCALITISDGEVKMEIIDISKANKA